MISVQKGHFSVGFDPDFVFRVLSKDIERSDVELEFASLCEFAETDAQGDEMVSGDACGEIDVLLAGEEEKVSGLCSG